MSKIPWDEKVPMLSIHPDAADRNDVAKLASELMCANSVLRKIEDEWGVVSEVMKLYPAESPQYKFLFQWSQYPKGGEK